MWAVWCLGLVPQPCFKKQKGSPHWWGKLIPFGWGILPWIRQSPRKEDQAKNHGGCGRKWTNQKFWHRQLQYIIPNKYTVVYVERVVTSARKTLRILHQLFFCQRNPIQFHFCEVTTRVLASRPISLARYHMIHKETNVTGLFPKLIHRFLSSSPSRAIDLVASDTADSQKCQAHTSTSHVKMLKDQKKGLYIKLSKISTIMFQIACCLVMNLQSFCVSYGANNCKCPSLRHQTNLI